jgi:hypothetical protein
MKLITGLALITLLSINQQAWGYGSSSSSKSCTKPQFSDFKPETSSTVSAQSTFSFIASENTNPKSIAVTIKQQTVETTITKIPQGYEITGKLPNIQGAARININAETVSACKASDGWLININ